MTQEETILKYMQEHDGITTYESTYELGITRLSARIADLKEAGCIIQDEWKQVTNRKGEKVKIKLYRFIRKAGEEQTLWG